MQETEAPERARQLRSHRPRMKARYGKGVAGFMLLMFLAQSLLFQISCHLAEEQPVRITIQPQDLIAIEGESTELNCDAEGDPKPSIEWYHNGQLIKSFTQSRTTMGGSIQFLDIRPSGPSSRDNVEQGSDAGVYHCLAKNQYGEARSRNATLQVACKYFPVGGEGRKLNSELATALSELSMFCRFVSSSAKWMKVVLLLLDQGSK